MRREKNKNEALQIQNKQSEKFECAKVEKNDSKARVSLSQSFPLSINKQVGFWYENERGRIYNFIQNLKFH